MDASVSSWLFKIKKPSYINSNEALQANVRLRKIAKGVDNGMH